MKRSAIISDCGRYRYVLTREWGTYPPRALCVMLNPSTADAEVDDATIRSCVRLAKENGHGSLEVVNLLGVRPTRANWRRLLIQSARSTRRRCGPASARAKLSSAPGARTQWPSSGRKLLGWSLGPFISAN